MEILRPNVSKEIAGAMKDAMSDLRHSERLIVGRLSDDYDPTTNFLRHMLIAHARNLRKFLDLAPLSEENNRIVLEIMIEQPEIFDLLRQFATSHLRTPEILLIALKELAIKEVRASTSNDTVVSAP